MLINRFRVIKRILLLLMLPVLLSAQPVDDSSRVVKVLSFNILHGATTKGDFNLDTIAHVINALDPDLVALQEVDYRTNRAKHYDLATELGWRVKMTPIFGRAMFYDGGEYGEAILSKSTFIKSRNVALPYSPGSEPRAALEITTVLPWGDTISFVGTHLDHLRDEKDRVAQVRAINQCCADNSYPTILAGDLNAIPGSKPINILEEHWIGSYDQSQPQPTYPSTNPQKKIDYVFYYPASRWEVLDSRVIEDPVASDHCALFVRLKLLK